MTEPDEGVMSKIMKLLEKANHPNTPVHEARVAEQMAEKLMGKHMIDRFEAEQAAKRSGHTRRKPIADEWEIVMSAYRNQQGDYQSDTEFDFQIIQMMKYVLKHCNVKVNPNHEYGSRDIGEGRSVRDPHKRFYKIVGYPEDIAYAERIWFNVFKTFVQSINPQWSLDSSVEHNAYNFASAGVSWKDQVLLAEKAGDTRLKWPWRYQDQDENAPFYTTYKFQVGETIDPGNKPWGQSIHKLKRACKKYCDDTGHPYPYAGGSKLRIASRSSFARSYRSTICSRLDEIRRLASEGAESVDTNKFALAVLDTKEQVDAEFYRLFPEFDPEIRRKQREAQEFEAACMWASLSEKEQAKVLRDMAKEEERWAKAATRSRRNYRTVREDPADRYDHAAWTRGRAAAQSVNLRNDAEVKEETRKGIK